VIVPLPIIQLIVVIIIFLPIAFGLIKSIGVPATGLNSPDGIKNITDRSIIIRINAEFVVPKYRHPFTRKIEVRMRTDVNMSYFIGFSFKSPEISSFFVRKSEGNFNV